MVYLLAILLFSCAAFTAYGKGFHLLLRPASARSTWKGGRDLYVDEFRRFYGWTPRLNTVPVRTLLEHSLYLGSSSVFQTALSHFYPLDSSRFTHGRMVTKGLWWSFLFLFWLFAATAYVVLIRFFWDPDSEPILFFDRSVRFLEGAISTPIFRMTVFCMIAVVPNLLVTGTMVLGFLLFLFPDFLARSVPRPQLRNAAEYSINQSTTGFQGVINRFANKLNPAEARYRQEKAEQRILRLEVGGKGCGTAWLVGPDLILTAYHVIEDCLDRLDLVTCSLDYKFIPSEKGLLLRTLDPPISLAEKGPLVASSPPSARETERSEQGPTQDEKTLDYALLRLSEAVGLNPIGAQIEGAIEKRGWFDLSQLEIVQFHRQQGLSILGHPFADQFGAAGPLMLSVAIPSQVQMAPGNRRIRYVVNTAEGNSGGPVLDQFFRPVGLHHFHVEQGQPVALWPNGFNQGIPLNLIVDDICAELTEREDFETLQNLGLRDGD